MKYSSIERSRAIQPGLTLMNLEVLDRLPRDTKPSLPHPLELLRGIYASELT
jgi:hypothetical protein